MTTPERAPERTPVRYGESPDGRPGPDDRAGGDWTERLALRNWSLPVKLTAVLLVPTIFVLTLGVLRIVEQTQEAASYDGVQQAVALEDSTSRVLGDLADERSAAAVYVAANRAGGSGPVEQRIAATRDATSELRRSAGAADSLDQQTVTAFDQADDEIDQLDRLRDDVIDGRVDAAGAIARYTETIDTLEVFDRSLSREAADPSVAGLSSGLYALSVVREEDAYVQAVVAAGIAAGRIDAPSIDQARNATLRRSIAVDDFRSAVGTDNAGLADAVVGPDVDNRDLLAQVVLGRGAAGLPLQVAGPDWERASAAVEDRDAATSEQLRGQLQEQAGSLQAAARSGAGIASVILLLALMAGAAVVFFVTRSLLRPLRLLRRTALDVAERRLPQAVKSLREGETPDTTIVPTPINTREEIGQVARAFDQVHEQAVRLAAEQAGLRSAFNSIFVNLSRRSQALVERQLRLIEQLENSEEDPEALSNLFQLDHLATRMRRNSENLLVLSGTDLSRRGSRPVPLVDVLRAAASEVEQYQRIDLAPPPQAQLLGRTASDVVHLVAELLENATTFSAPDTRVRVQATQNGDGSVLVEILDSGVGMSEDDLHEANVRLDSPPTVDVSASRRMGLFVVGRLATRHGITVELRNREDGGVAATALVPASAVLAGATEGRPALGAGSAPRRPEAPTGHGAVPEQARAAGGLPQRERRAAGAPGSFFAPGADPGQEQGRPPASDGAPERRPLPRRGSSDGAPATNGHGTSGHGTNGHAGPGGPRLPGRPGGPGGPAGPAGPGRPPEREPADGTEEQEASAATEEQAPEQEEQGRHGFVGGAAAAGGAAALIGAAAARRRSRRAEEPGEDDGAPAEPSEQVEPVDEDDLADDELTDDGEDLSWKREDAEAPAEAPDAPPQERPQQQGPPQGAPQGPLPGLPGQPGGPGGMGAPTGPGGFGGGGGATTPGAPGRPAGPVWGPPPGGPAGPGGPGPGQVPPPGWRGAPPGRGPAGPYGPPPPGGPPRRPAAGPPMWNGAPVVPPPGPVAGEEQADEVEEREEVAAPAEASVDEMAAPAEDAVADEVTEAPEMPETPAPEDEAPSPEALPTRRGMLPLRPRVVRPQARPAWQAGSPEAEAAPTPETPADGERLASAQDGAVEAPESPEAAEAPEPSTPGEPRGMRPSGRRLPPPGAAFSPGMAPRLRPRRAAGEPDEAPEPTETSEATAAPEQSAPPEESAAPDVAPAEPVTPPEPPAPAEPRRPAAGPQGPGALPRRGGPQGPQGPQRPGPSGPAAPLVPAGAPAAGGPPDRLFDPAPASEGNGHTRNGGGGGAPARATPERLPTRAGRPQRERTPIYDEVASAWFREAPPAAGPDEAEWASTSGDEGWRAAAASADALDAGVSPGGTTEAGLPKRRPRAQLVPGAARPGDGPSAEGPAVPRRSADAIRGRLASYQQGVADGRSTRRGRPGETEGAPQDARPGDEEEQ